MSCKQWKQENDGKKDRKQDTIPSSLPGTILKEAGVNDEVTVYFQTNCMMMGSNTPCANPGFGGANAVEGLPFIYG